MKRASGIHSLQVWLQEFAHIEAISTAKASEFATWGGECTLGWANAVIDICRMRNLMELEVTHLNCELLGFFRPGWGRNPKGA